MISVVLNKRIAKVIIHPILTKQAAIIYLGKDLKKLILKKNCKTAE
jgi:hypothetical protein